MSLLTLTVIYTITKLILYPVNSQTMSHVSRFKVGDLSPLLSDISIRKLLTFIY